MPQKLDWLPPATRKALEALPGVRRLSAGECGIGPAARAWTSDSVYYEIALGAGGALRASLATTYRNISHDCEQAILDSRDTLEELIDLELHDLGDDEPSQTRHFAERPAFLFSVDIPLGHPDPWSRAERALRALSIAFADVVGD
jgi:hypothetical protein